MNAKFELLERNFSTIIQRLALKHLEIGNDKDKEIFRVDNKTSIETVFHFN